MSLLRVQINQDYQGSNNGRGGWCWRVAVNRGGLESTLAKGHSLTSEGAVYAATMEARLFDSNFGCDDSQEKGCEYCGSLEVNPKCPACQGIER